MSRISGHPPGYDPIFLEDDSPNSDYDADPLDDDSDNSDCDAVPLDDDSANSDCDAVPLDDQSVNSDCDAVPLDDESVNSDCDAVPLDDESVNSDCEAVPLDNDSVNSDSEDSDSDHTFSPSEKDSSDSGSDSEPLKTLKGVTPNSDYKAGPSKTLKDDTRNSDICKTSKDNTPTSGYESDLLNTLKDASTNSEYSDLFMDDSPNSDYGSDPLFDSEGKLDVVIDEDEEEFDSLKNCHIAGNSIALSLEDFTHRVQYTTCKQREFQESFPGVQASSFYEMPNPKSVLFGFLKIDPRTVKPFERTQNLKIIYTVLSGKIVVKSTELEEVNGLLTFQKNEIGQGSCIEVPAKHPYTLENRTDKEVVLQYVVLELPDRSS